MPTRYFEGTASVGREHMCMWIVHLGEYLLLEHNLSFLSSLSTIAQMYIHTMGGSTWLYVDIRQRTESLSPACKQ